MFVLCEIFVPLPTTDPTWTTGYVPQTTYQVFCFHPYTTTIGTASAEITTETINKLPPLLVSYYGYYYQIHRTVMLSALLKRKVLELHDTHSTPQCQIVMVPTIQEILHNGTTVDYHSSGASFRYTEAASTPGLSPRYSLVNKPIWQPLQPNYTAAE